MYLNYPMQTRLILCVIRTCGKNI